MAKPLERQIRLNGFLVPNQEVFKIKGKILYHESAQAWNTLKIKKEIFWIFPQLRDKSSNFHYTMIVPRNQEEAKEQIEKLKKNSNLVPILLFFEKEMNPDGKTKNINTS